MTADTEHKDPLIEEARARRGWWFSVVFLILVIALVLFLAYVRVVDENRDVLIGILGVITGSISSMLAIASGRDPSEVEELREQLSRANADRVALIARLRDAQIQLQLKNDQLFEMQSAIIDKLSSLAPKHGSVISTRDESKVSLHPLVDEWTPRD